MNTQKKYYYKCSSCGGNLKFKRTEHQSGGVSMGLYCENCKSYGTTCRNDNGDN